MMMNTGKEGPHLLPTIDPSSPAGVALRKALMEIRDRSGDAAFRGELTDVLSGRKSVRDLISSPSFSRLMDESARGLSKGLDKMSPEEREKTIRKMRGETDGPQPNV
jgi:hypothetical protein